MKNRHFLYLLTCLIVGCNTPAQKEVVRNLEAWQDDIIYFAMTDRFADGDSSNNDLGFGEYDIQREHSYHGGDLVGIEQHIPYLKELGITALWLTPPVKNVVWSRDSSIGGYHGYWASHFAQVDPHLGDLQTYQNLARKLKAQNIRLIQDVVTNHTGDYFTYTGPYHPENPQKNFSRRGAPEQPPFDLNDARKLAHRQAAIYHFTPSIENYQDSLQRLHWQMSDLDDLNTSNPVVIDDLKSSFRFWIDSVGIDGIRFDTPLYVDHPFWNQFLHDSNSLSPGLYPHALSKGQSSFYTFGETWVHSAPFSNKGEQQAAQYLGTPDHPEMDGILHFPMLQSIQRVFGGGFTTSEIAYRLAQSDSFFPLPWQKLHFIDNHDMPRFKALYGDAASKQALAFILTIPGIPVIYYGTEQGLKNGRENLFDKHNSLSKDFKFVQALIHIRKSSKAFSRGKLEVLADDSEQNGLLFYRLNHRNETKYVLFNCSDEPIYRARVDFDGYEGDAHMLMKFGEVQLGSSFSGRLEYLSLGPKSFAIFEAAPGTGTFQQFGNNLQITPLPSTLWQQDSLIIKGSYRKADSIVALVNGLQRLVFPAILNEGKFSLPLNLLNFPYGKQQIQILAFQKGRLTDAERLSIQTDLPLLLLARQNDPKADDWGPNQKYRYPIAFGSNRYGDLAALTVSRQGHSIQLDISMHSPFSTSWNPPNGFDHLYLKLLIGINGKGLGYYAPMNYTLQSGVFAWALGLGGWQSSLAQVQEDGSLKQVTATPTLKITSDRSLRLTLAPDLLAFPDSIGSINIELLSWDVEGEGQLRPLSKNAADYTFGGGNEHSPKYMDRITIQTNFNPNN
ncbi:MAG: alpha-amylase family glycosyl hydrolase [Bacteroidia bacterium]